MWAPRFEPPSTHVVVEMGRSDGLHMTAEVRKETYPMYDEEFEFDIQVCARVCMCAVCVCMYVCGLCMMRNSSLIFRCARVCICAVCVYVCMYVAYV